MLGTELFILDILTKLRAQGYFLRRRKPVLQKEAGFFTAREQRSNFVEA